MIDKEFDFECSRKIDARLVFCYGILLTKSFWPTVRKKKCSSDRDKPLKFKDEGRECKNFEITRTIYSDSARSEQFLAKEYFFKLFLEVSCI